MFVTWNLEFEIYLVIGIWCLEFINIFKELVMEIQWQDEAKKHFDTVITHLPQFHRAIAERLVKEKAEELAKTRNSVMVEDKDVIVAFFQEVPPAFKDMMKRLFSKHKIDYSQYINE